MIEPRVKIQELILKTVASYIKSPLGDLGVNSQMIAILVKAVLRRGFLSNI